MSTLSLRAVALTASFFAFAAPALAQDMTFTLSNASGVTLVEFYASPIATDDWEEDILGDQVLESGQTGEVLIADGRANCDYDFLMIFEDGEELEDTVDICELGSYTIE